MQSISIALTSQMPFMCLGSKPSVLITTTLSFASWVELGRHPLKRILIGYLTYNGLPGAFQCQWHPDGLLNNAASAYVCVAD